MYESFQGNDYYVWDHVLFSDVRSDNNYAGGDNPQIFQIDAINIDVNNDRVYNAWSAILQCNCKSKCSIRTDTESIQRLLTEERRQQILGEA